MLHAARLGGGIAGTSHESDRLLLASGSSRRVETVNVTHLPFGEKDAFPIVWMR